MHVEVYQDLRACLVQAGYGSEIEWAQTVKPVADPGTFWREYGWVVVNSGMRNQVARGIWERVRPYLERGEPIPEEAFRHEGKRRALDYVRLHAGRLLADYQEAQDKLAFLRGLPWIGGITCYHLAKNFGHDVAKPDRHLERIASYFGTDPVALCARLARESGDRVATVDLVLWRAANLGLLRTLEMLPGGGV